MTDSSRLACCTLLPPLLVPAIQIEMLEKAGRPYRPQGFHQGVNTNVPQFCVRRRTAINGFRLVHRDRAFDLLSFEGRTVVYRR
jgi:hypothetical protein